MNRSSVGHWLRPSLITALLGSLMMVLLGMTGLDATLADHKAPSSWPPNVFAVGTFAGTPGNVTTTENVASIQLAVNDAESWATMPANEAGCGGVPCDSYVLL